MPQRKKVLVLADLRGEGRARLEKYCDVVVRPETRAGEDRLCALLAGFHGILCLLTHRISDRVLAAGDRLEMVANCAVGLDNIDLVAAQRRGIVVTHTPGVLTEDTADLTWALILDVVRRVSEADRFVRRGEYRGWEPNLFLGRSLRSMTLGVIGAGRIGRAVLARGSAFGMRTFYHSRRRIEPAVERELGCVWCSKEELLAASDIVSLHVSLSEQSRHLVDATALRAMRRGSFLINTARGEVVDEAALVEALTTGHLGGAGLDVFEREPSVPAPLLEMENVVLLPHIGSATEETRIRMANCCFEDLLQGLVYGKRPERAVAFEGAPAEGTAAR